MALVPFATKDLVDAITVANASQFASLFELLSPHVIGGFNPANYAASIGVGGNDTAAFQAAIDKAVVLATAGGTVTPQSQSGPIAAVIIPPGQYLVDGLVCNSGRVRFFSLGCELKSFANQATETPMLKIAGDYNEAGHFATNQIEGIVFNGNDRTNVAGLWIKGGSHVHVKWCRFRACKQGGLIFDESYDSVIIGCYTQFCGTAGTNAVTSVAATRMISSTVDAPNRLDFIDCTWETNNGLDVGFYTPSGTFWNYSFEFNGCKWEQGGSSVLFAGIYTGDGFINNLIFSGSTYSAGYSRTGPWLDVALGSSCNLVIEDGEWGYKTLTGGTDVTPARMKIRGNANVRIGGRITDALIDGQVFLDTQTMSDSQINLKNIFTSLNSRRGFQWRHNDGQIVRCVAIDGEFYYTWKILDSTLVTFTPPNDSGRMFFLAHDNPGGGFSCRYRCDGTQNISGVGDAGSSIVLTAAADLASGTAGTAGKMNVNVGLTQITICNRLTFTQNIYLSFPNMTMAY